MITHVPIDDVMRRIALAVLPSRQISEDLGDITLEPHQLEAAQRLGIMLARHRGALLADVVGSGKTYTALALAKLAVSPLVVAPAALRDNWTRAFSLTGVDAAFVSAESLSRAVRLESIRPDLVIVDESHHFRNEATRRYRNLATLCTSANVLLLSATPLQNRTVDLASQLAIFLGARAHAMSGTELASFVVRRGRTQSRLRLPAVDGPHWIDVPPADDWLDDLLGLPSVIGPADGGDGGALLSYVLVRRWASSRAALLATLRRRLAASLALESALEVGRRPTRRELGAWSVADEAMQLAFPELVAVPIGVDTGIDCTSLLGAVRDHRDALRELISRIRRAPDPDADRAAAVAHLLELHPNEIVIAFSEHAETVDALAKHLIPLGGVVCLTSRGARTVSGRWTRADVLRQLEPRAPAMPMRERLRLLLSTDVLSEGVNLQRASVVVHIDLPWNPARLEQRVGRARRLGATHDRVTVYALSPPSDTERLLEIDQRLRRKLDVAARTIGVSGRILPPPWGSLPADPCVEQGEAEMESDVMDLLQSWLAGSSRHTPRRAEADSCAAHSPVWSAVAIPDNERAQFLALVRLPDEALLVADLGDGISSRARDVRHALELALRRAGPAREIAPERLDDAIVAVDRWCESRLASRIVGAATSPKAGVATSSAARRGALARLARIGANLPRQSRASVAPAVERARAVVAQPMSIGAEQVLATIVDAALDDRAWLHAIDGFAQAHQPRLAQSKTGAPASAPPSLLLALILFVPEL